MDTVWAMTEANREIYCVLWVSMPMLPLREMIGLFWACRLSLVLVLGTTRPEKKMMADLDFVDDEGRGARAI